MKSEAISERKRDLVAGSTRTRALFTLYEWLNDSKYLPMFNRVFQGIPKQHVKSAYAQDISCSDPSAQYREMIHLGSYNYSGLNSNPRVLEAAMSALKEYGLTTSGVRLLNGSTNLHLNFEKKLSSFLGTQDAVTYSSGYAANISVLSALCSEKDVVFSDELNHQSIADGLKLSRARIIKFPHKDVNNLSAILENIPKIQRKFIVTDGIFSMDGDVARLDKIVDLAKKHNAFVIVDDAHATAAFGPNGRGTPAYYDVVNEIDILTGSLSKGLPGVGGFAAGSKHSMDFLRYASNGYIFSASLPPSIPAGLSVALNVLESEPEIQFRLHKNESSLRNGIKNIGLDIMHSESPIIPILLPNRDITFRFAKLLYAKDIFVNPICFPAVSRRLPRLRLNASASLSEDDIDKSLECIKLVAQQLGLV